jgi:hypothetical protein
MGSLLGPCWRGRERRSDEDTGRRWSAANQNAKTSCGEATGISPAPRERYRRFLT